MHSEGGSGLGSTQNPALILMWVPPAGASQTPPETERTFCHFHCFDFVLQLQT